MLNWIVTIHKPTITKGKVQVIICLWLVFKIAVLLLLLSFQSWIQDISHFNITVISWSIAEKSVEEKRALLTSRAVSAISTLVRSKCLVWLTPAPRLTQLSSHIRGAKKTHQRSSIPWLTRRYWKICKDTNLLLWSWSWRKEVIDTISQPKISSTTRYFDWYE